MDAKEKLLNAAERCIMERGSHAASVKAIAAMAGVNHGLVHHYFGSKEGLFIELVKKHFETTNPPALVTEEDIIHYFMDIVIFNSKMMIELRALSFHMIELNKALVAILHERRERIQNILHIDEEKATLLIAAASGLGFQSSLDLSMDIKEYFRKILRLVTD